MQFATIHFGPISFLPAVVAIVFAIMSKRTIESLLLGILSAVLILDAASHGWGHSLLYSIVNVFKAIAGHPKTEELEGMGTLKDAGRAEVIIFVMLLGAFINTLDRSGGALAFGESLAKKVRTKQGAQNAAALMGCAVFTSAYFSCLATGTVFRPIFDKMKISREKLAFIIDSTSAPINTLVPISGWVAYMAALMSENIPNLEDGFKGLLYAIPFNFYCLTILAFVFLLANARISDYGAMKKEEEKVAEGESHRVRIRLKETPDIEIQNARAADMLMPLGIVILVLVVLGLWNYTFAYFFEGVNKLPLGGTQILLVSFSLGILAAFSKYTLTGLMTATEFLDDALEGTKMVIHGGLIIILALTLGDLLRAPAPEGLGAAQYLQSSAGTSIPHGIVPLAVFLVSAFTSFSMGTSWGVWGIMMPIAIPLTLATDGNAYLAAAAVLSGGTFGDHCSPISDTTIMSSIGAECNHMKHVNTQLPYALTAAGVSSLLFLIAGFIF